MEYNEKILEDDYPMFDGYLYVKDGEVIKAFFSGTAGEFKEKIGCKEIKSCDIAGRNIWHLAE